MAGIGLAVVVSDLDWPLSGVGLHVGFFGGAGFGAMLAAVLQAVPYEDHNLRRARHQRQSELR